MNPVNSGYFDDWSSGSDGQCFRRDGDLEPSAHRDCNATETSASGSASSGAMLGLKSVLSVWQHNS